MGVIGSEIMAQALGESRQRVLDTALRLFGEHGYGGTSLQAIAAELGLTKASVYYHFQAKGDLLDALASPYLARVDVILADPPDTTEPAGCRMLLAAYLAALADHRVEAALLIGDPTIGTHPVAIRGRAQRDRLRTLLAQAGSPPVGAVRATCCLGALQTPVFDVPAAAAAANLAIILDAAVRALGGVARAG
jgi:AcrR family transcriptional regulator